MQTAYRLPMKPTTPETSLNGHTIPVEVMPVKSLIAAPADGQRVKVGLVTIQGVAWAGETKVVKVELSMDEGKTWEPARFVGEDHYYAWRRWQFIWPAKVQGTFTIVCRATDARGDFQPAVSSWNPSGFLWNGWDRVTVVVNA